MPRERYFQSRVGGCGWSIARGADRANGGDDRANSRGPALQGLEQLDAEQLDAFGWEAGELLAAVACDLPP